MRFLYEFFLELCIFVLLQLSIADYQDFTPGFEFFIALGILLLIGALISFVVSLFMWKGPWVPGFFKKKTLMQSFFKVRERNLDFDAEKWLKEHPAVPIKSWGTFIINFDLRKLSKCFFRSRKKAKVEALAENEEKNRQRELSLLS